MLNKRIFSFVVLLLVTLTVPVAVAETGADDLILIEVRLESRAQLERLSALMSFDEATRGLDAAIWASRADLQTLEQLGLSWREVVEVPSSRALTTCVDADGPPFTPPASWNCYPSWSQYQDLMQYYADTYPGVCRLITIGSTGTGNHSLLALKISDNPDAEEDEAEFFYTATMHGDELAGYPMTLRLAHELLTNYGSVPEITSLVDEMVIWINPLANPDGTFPSSDSSVSGSQRNYVSPNTDPNRSFPEPLLGDDPGSGTWPVETQAMMDLAKAESFTMSANFHGGAEVANYPWDNTVTRHADDAWYQIVSQEYADNAQAASPSGYMSGFSNGITNGYDWYAAPGCRQDFMNHYYGCREITVELSDVKQLDSGQIENNWDWNRQALLDYMKQADWGLRGVVSDVNTGSPLAATVKVVGHDINLTGQRSWVFTDPDAGDYHRPIEAGSWDIEVSAGCFQPSTVNGLVVTAGAATRADVQLTPSSVHTVSGVVTEEGSGSPVASAQVSIVGTSITPDSTTGAGAYVLQQVWGCTHTLRVVAVGYAVYEQQITVSAGSTQFNVELPVEYQVSGTVTDASNGQAVAGAGISLTDTNLTSVFSNGVGAYTVDGVLSGAHTLVVTAAGFATSSQAITVSSGSTVFDVQLVPSIFVIDEGFENSDGGFSGNLNWQRGADSMAGVRPGGTGSNVWGTVLNADYGANNAEWPLDSPAIDIPTDALSAVLSFYHWYETEASYDGGQIQVSADGGFFTAVPSQPGGVNPTLGIDALDGAGGGWAGDGSTWQQIQVDLMPWAGSSVVVRWRFATDVSQTSYRGWYIDDVQVAIASPPAPAGEIFGDGFESGNMAQWSSLTP